MLSAIRQYWVENNVHRGLIELLPYIGWFIIAGGTNVPSENFCHARRIKEEIPLDDEVLDWLFVLHDRSWADYFVIFLPGFVFLSTLFPRFHIHHAKLLLWMESTMVILRNFTITLTYIPDPRDWCYTREMPPLDMRYILTHVDVIHCTDMMFSGHVFIMIICALYWQTYGTNRFHKALIWALSIIGSVLNLASRQHYTVDIIVSWYLTPLVWCAVHYWLVPRNPKYHYNRLGDPMNCYPKHRRRLMSQKHSAVEISHMGGLNDEDIHSDMEYISRDEGGTSMAIEMSGNLRSDEKLFTLDDDADFE